MNCVVVGTEFGGGEAVFSGKEGCYCVRHCRFGVLGECWIGVC